jgi:hypothetical protein
VAVTWSGQKVAKAGVFVYAPSIASVSPATGGRAGGTQVTISGTGFDPDGTQVLFGGVAATNVVVVNSTTITATAPAHAAGSVTVSVISDGETGVKSHGFLYS